MGVEKWFDFVLLVVFLAFGTVMLGISLGQFDKSLAVLVEDKSVVRPEDGIIVDVEAKTGKDILMELVIADEFIQYPRAIKINSNPIIKITDEWLLAKNQNVARIYSATGDQKLSTMLDWTVESVTFVHDPSGVDYLWYSLVP